MPRFLIAVTDSPFPSLDPAKAALARVDPELRMAKSASAEDILAVARRARAFGLQIHYHNRRPVSLRIAEELEATYWESLDQMLAHMDIVSVNCPHTPATYHLLSARRLKLLQPKAYIVNTARGEVIDENALARGLASGEIAGAGLDVFEHEPKVDAALRKMPNVVLAPHLGSAVVEVREQMANIVVDNILALLGGKTPPNCINPEVLRR